LHSARSMHRADATRRDRYRELDGRHGHDPKDQYPAMDLRRQLRRGSGALCRHAICRCHAHADIARRYR
jgi:hypothetical protein